VSVYWHLMFWVMLPLSLYATVWAYAEWRKG